MRYEFFNSNFKDNYHLYAIPHYYIKYWVKGRRQRRWRRRRRRKRKRKWRMS